MGTAWINLEKLYCSVKDLCVKNRRMRGGTTIVKTLLEHHNLSFQGLSSTLPSFLLFFI